MAANTFSRFKRHFFLANITSSRKIVKYFQKRFFSNYNSRPVQHTQADPKGWQRVQNLEGPHVVEHEDSFVQNLILVYVILLPEKSKEIQNEHNHSGYVAGKRVMLVPAQPHHVEHQL